MATEDEEVTVGWRGDQLTRLREARGLNRHRLAIAIGTKDDQVRRWEINETSPQAHYFMRLCVFFGVPAGTFFGMEEGRGEARQSIVAIVRNALGESEAAVLTCMGVLTEAEKERVVERAMALRELREGSRAEDNQASYAAKVVGPTAATVEDKIEKVKGQFPPERIEKLSKLKKGRKS